MTRSPLGYEALIKLFDLKVIPHFRSSFVLKGASKSQRMKEGGRLVFLYPETFLPKNQADPFEHLLFAISEEGINLAILKALFAHISQAQIQQFVLQEGYTKESRKIWYLFEFLTQTRCSVQDMPSGRYVSLIDSAQYFTSKAEKIPRQRIYNNLLGNYNFSPMVRKTGKLKKGLSPKPVGHVLQKDAVLYSPKTFPIAIEEEVEEDALDRERSSDERRKKFIQLIQQAESIPELTQEALINLHAIIIHTTKADKGLRTYQNYLVIDLPENELLITQICPKPKDVPVLLEGLLGAMRRMRSADIDPAIIASVTAFGFSILHPFGDGNGRLQLFILYYLLLHSRSQALGRFICPSLPTLFYDPEFSKAIAHFDNAILKLVKYTLHEDETMTVHEETIDFYRYIDFTPLVEFVYGWIEELK